MFIAMNRFQVRRGHEEDFERVWRERDSKLGGSPGFVEFRMLRGPAGDDHTLYSSFTKWASRADFEVWTRSDAFQEAHKNAGDHKHMYLDRPRFEGFEVLDDIG